MAGSFRTAVDIPDIQFSDMRHSYFLKCTMWYTDDEGGGHFAKNTTGTCDIGIFLKKEINL